MVAHSYVYSISVSKVNNHLLCDIDGAGLTYADLYTHHGAQTNHWGGTAAHEEIERLCQEVSDRMKRIHELNNDESLKPL